MITSKTYKSDGTVETVTHENVDYFEMIGLTPEILMKRVRFQRNKLLQQTDWRMVSDYPGSNQNEWQSYRQALRVITTQSPSLDENGQLTGITWPTPPSND